MSQAELNALIVANIQDLDAAAHHLDQVLQHSIAEAIDERLEDLIKQAAWDGAPGWNDGDAWVAPKAWHRPDHGADEYSAYFECDVDDKKLDARDAYQLTQLVGKAHARRGFRWVQQPMGNAAWAKIAGKCLAEIQELRSLGFEYREKDGTFFLPIVVDPDELASALADDDISRALGSVDRGFETMQTAVRVFNRLLTNLVVD
ncbi:MAG TPA: hypothetical protein VGR32_05075 [Brevundimonas sp.]|jgi:hypothetical protein|uniref:hypothetical protein n=1 Tax=Brevundimonas sp. TaxID=1871086 RepID=UPI002DE28FAE|nr:hypothetical protein [Brevundimonas sp.]